MLHRIEIENKIENNWITEILHEPNPQSQRKVSACKFTDDLYSVPSAEIIVSKWNPVYANLNELKTLVRIINTKTGITEFDGRILQISEESMNTSGIITKKLICEGIQGYLCDTVQLYHHYETVDVHEFLSSLLTYHNAVMYWHSPERCIQLGAVTVHDSDSKTTAQRTTMEEIKENLISRLGGILQTRRDAQNQILLDYYQESDYGQICDTTVEIAVNMKSISSGTDATGVITRLYPFGCQLNTDTDERLTIVSVNNNCPYIDNEAAILKYGVKCGSYIWDDVTSPEQLLKKGREYLNQACTVKKSYRATVLDLSAIGKAADSFQTGNTYRFINPLLNLDEYLKIVKITTDIFKPYQPVIEIGDRLEKITDITTQTRNYVEYEIPKQKSEILQQAKNNASALITSATHGNVIVEPEEILIMNTNSKDTATKIWRFNINGLGYSHSDTPGQAYDGEYGLAMTMDGAFVADYITAGTMSANLIRGGTLGLGHWQIINPETGTTTYVDGNLQVKDADGNIVLEVDQTGLYQQTRERSVVLTDGWIRGSIENGTRSDTGISLDNHFGSGTRGISIESYVTGDTSKGAVAIVTPSLYVGENPNSLVLGVTSNSISVKDGNGRNDFQFVNGLLVDHTWDSSDSLYDDQNFIDAVKNIIDDYTQQT